MKLNPEQTWNELHLLMGNVEPVLLCWKSLGSSATGNWLHDGSDVSWELRLKSTILGPRRSLIFFEPAPFRRGWLLREYPNFNSG
ncbi:TPA: hypothetical protein P7R58_000831 [Salmonella enterica]|uniref:hypothetical protein n=1 Tax=Salmonella TaxID=590 RepID=UPI000A6D1E55|nr:hypothetical protein [Salmonella enterica]EGF4607554.1 hypothetical protein [Salmonella enterica subsp. enterica serovar Kedougou]EHV5969963.1 hypothetical protein [Salmonella enterica subsp. enterica serovar Kedougou]EJH2342048.1 hypothetical protein [Salmonella enterica]MCI0124018.1 hypothetical protein [Salmonella enterica]HAU3370291.1 hypothetical protein [Salmonella enterica]